MSLLKDMREVHELVEMGVSYEDAMEAIFGVEESCNCEDYPCCGH